MENTGDKNGKEMRVKNGRKEMKEEIVGGRRKRRHRSGKVRRTWPRAGVEEGGLRTDSNRKKA